MCEQVALADVAEDGVEGGSEGCCQEKETGEGEDRSRGRGDARGREPDGRRKGSAVKQGTRTTTRPVRKADLVGAVREAEGLELRADEENAREGSGEPCGSREVGESLTVDDDEREGGEAHAEEVEEQGRAVGEGVFDEGGAPEGGDGEEEGEGSWFQVSLNQRSETVC